MNALELSGMRKSFGRTEIIRGIDLAIPAGERHAIIGPNGAGKSTLFNLISGRFAVSSGTIRLNGQPITNRRPYEINPEWQPLKVQKPFILKTKLAVLKLERKLILF